MSTTHQLSNETKQLMDECGEKLGFNQYTPVDMVMKIVEEKLRCKLKKSHLMVTLMYHLQLDTNDPNPMLEKKKIELNMKLEEGYFSENAALKPSDEQNEGKTEISIFAWKIESPHHTMKQSLAMANMATMFKQLGAHPDDIQIICECSPEMFKFRGSRRFRFDFAVCYKNHPILLAEFDENSRQHLSARGRQKNFSKNLSCKFMDIPLMLFRDEQDQDLGLWLTRMYRVAYDKYIVLDENRKDDYIIRRVIQSGARITPAQLRILVRYWNTHHDEKPGVSIKDVLTNMYMVKNEDVKQYLTDFKKHMKENFQQCEIRGDDIMIRYDNLSEFNYWAAHEVLIDQAFQYVQVFEKLAIAAFELMKQDRDEKVSLGLTKEKAWRGVAEVGYSVSQNEAEGWQHERIMECLYEVSRLEMWKKEYKDLIEKMLELPPGFNSDEFTRFASEKSKFRHSRFSG